jgi:hypothetical protein
VQEPLVKQDPKTHLAEVEQGHCRIGSRDGTLVSAQTAEHPHEVHGSGEEIVLLVSSAMGSDAAQGGVDIGSLEHVLSGG